MDLIARVRQLPQPGETVTSTTLTTMGGGKGANQALAAARLGAAVSLVSAVGCDAYGRQILATLSRHGVDTSCVRQIPDAATGTALIAVDDDGENTIVVNPGASSMTSLDGADLTGPDAVLAQLEVPLPLVQQAAELTAGVFCLNASPFTELPDDVLRRCDLIIVNESEYRTGRHQLDDARLVCVTLGARGAELLAAGARIAYSTSPTVNAIDTVGAGDMFAAALLVEGLRTGDPQRALRAACREGANATTRVGAQDPTPLPGRNTHATKR